MFSKKKVAAANAALEEKNVEIAKLVKQIEELSFYAQKYKEMEEKFSRYEALLYAVAAEFKGMNPNTNSGYIKRARSYLEAAGLL